MKKFLVVLCMFLSVLLSGCGRSVESDPRLRPSEPSLTSERTARTTSQEPTLNGLEDTLNPWPWDDLPLRADGAARERVGGTSPPIDDLPDAGADLHDAPVSPSPTGPIFRSLSANTCNDRPLRLSSDVQRYVTVGYTLWHLCYGTPSYPTPEHPFTSTRPTEVVFTFFHEPSQTTRELATIAVPRGTSPWTVNSLIALPPGTRPFLNIDNRYSSGDHLYAIQPARWNEDIQLWGVLRSWQVSSDGTQTLSVPGALCMHVSPRDIVTGREYFFVPHTNCPDGIESCRLNSYECTDLFASSL